MFKKSNFDLEENVNNNPNYLGYLRMYWRNGWNHRFFNSEKDTTVMGGITGMSQLEIDELNRVVDEIADIWSNGCDEIMKNNLKKKCLEISPNNRYLLEADGILIKYELLCDTTFGNKDYPVRIYMFRKSK